MDRRLTTLLSADIAGYSRLMEADEQATYEALKTCLDEVIRPEIDRCNGHIVKLMGDGILAEFASVVDAARCAVSIQRIMARRAGDQPEDRRLLLRIGIHLGDVIAETDDIYGDGVNVAARLESLARPGTICVSRQVLDQIEPHMDIAWTDLGPCRVKNISRPIHAYCADPVADGSVPPRKARTLTRAVLMAVIAMTLAIAAGLYWQAGRKATAPQDSRAALARAGALPSLAVLPFESLSDDPGQDYLADGMTDDLITDLAKVSGLLVIARESSFAYKGDRPVLDTVARDLGVRYVVQGSLRRAGERIRINAQLVDTDTGAHIWAERYDRDTADIFALQDDVRSRIVAALKVKLTPEESEQLARPLTTSPDAYDAYLRARQQESFFTRDSTEAAIRYYHQALEFDPDFVVAKARLASAYTILTESGWSPDAVATLDLALSLAKEAIAKNDRLPIAYWALARVYTRQEFFDGDKAIASLEKSIEIDPNYADAYAMLANTMFLIGHSEKGLARIETAMRLNPHFPFWYYFALGANQFHLTRYDAAESSFQKAIERNPTWLSSHKYLVATYGHLGRPDDADWEMEELRSLGFEPTIANWRATTKYQDKVYEALFFDGLRKAGVPEG
ncbi:MAG: adenylate/guanylate cyclase domain-containing protein [Marinibacterium sp.]